MGPTKPGQLWNLSGEPAQDGDSRAPPCFQIQIPAREARPENLHWTRALGTLIDKVLTPRFRKLWASFFSSHLSGGEMLWQRRVCRILQSWKNPDSFTSTD